MTFTCVSIVTAEYAAGRFSVTNGLIGAMSVEGENALNLTMESRGGEQREEEDDDVVVVFVWTTTRWGVARRAPFVKRSSMSPMITTNSDCRTGMSIHSWE